MARMCRKMNWTLGQLPTDPIAYKFLVVDDQHKMIYCKIPKTGTTTFLALLAHSAAGRTLNETNSKNFSGKVVQHPKVLHESGIRFLSEYKLEEIHWRLKHYWKFLAVRHPLTRLHSAWVNCYTIGNKSDPLPQMVPQYKKISNMTWETFVQLVATESSFRNMHWQTYDSRCFPCGISYDHIVKLETLDNDIETVLSKLKGPYSSAHSIPHNNRQQTDSPEKQLILLKTLYRSFSEDIMNGLFKRYEQDFSLFGYDWISSTKPQDYCKTPLHGRHRRANSCC